MHHKGSIALAVVTGFIVAAGIAGSADAASTITLVDWEMNEPAGATVMVDSGPNHIDGAIGSAVTTGTVVSGATGYKWSSTQPNQPPTKPERLIQIQDSRLNAGSRDIAVTIRYRSTHSYGNIIQKGQNGTPGGYFKFEQPLGIMACLFKGSTGSVAVRSPIATNDGAWHTFRCEKTATSVTMTIDGTRTVKTNGRPGSISNTIPMTIGGKLNCNQDTITCDYFAGGLDYVKIETS
ncbi:MAG TPA: LamG domain-containing protein [Kineosporiaceae bacterium]|nr:LamG domain-containing protein [Kineosporiaceae bacterium]